MKSLLLAIVLLASSQSFAATQGLVCSDAQGDEAFLLSTPNGASYRPVLDVKNNRRYSAEVEDIASDRVDYKTIDFTIMLQTMGIELESCENGNAAQVFRTSGSSELLCCKLGDVSQIYGKVK